MYAHEGTQPNHPGCPEMFQALEPSEKQELCVLRFCTGTSLASFPLRRTQRNETIRRPWRAGGRQTGTPRGCSRSERRRKQDPVLFRGVFLCLKPQQLNPGHTLHRYHSVARPSCTYHTCVPWSTPRPYLGNHALPELLSDGACPALLSLRGGRRDRRSCSFSCSYGVLRSSRRSSLCSAAAALHLRCPFLLLLRHHSNMGEKTQQKKTRVSNLN